MSFSRLTSIAVRLPVIQAILFKVVLRAFSRTNVTSVLLACSIFKNSSFLKANTTLIKEKFFQVQNLVKRDLK